MSSDTKVSDETTHDTETVEVAVDTTTTEPAAVETPPPAEADAQDAVSAETVAEPVEAVAEAAAESTEPEAAAEPAAEVEAAPETPAPAETEPAAEAEPVAEPEAAAEPDAATEPEATAEATTASPADSPAEAPDAAAAVAETDADAAAAAAEPAAPAEPPENLKPLYAALESKERVTGKVIGWNKGGFHVGIGGVPAFCPKSQIELGNPKKAQSYVDKDLQFRVIEIRDSGKRIVVSRTEILTEDRAALLAKLREHQKNGEPLEGRVSSITDFGAFVDLGGIEGLVHLSALSRRRVDRASDVVQIGQDVTVKVTKIEKGGERISLSMKALEPDPWKGVEERYGTGTKHTGTILRSAEFGLFVELEPGLEGLVHTSQLPLGKTLEDESLAPGTAVDVWVREADGRRRRLALAMREVAQGNPWEKLGERYEEGQTVKGTVEQVAKFGIFVNLEPGLTGLLPFSVLSLPGDMNPRRAFRLGQEVEAQIAEIDPKRRRMSLAPLGTQLAGTKADLKEYQKQSRDEGGLNAMAAAFARLQKD